jgi:hypothetical protein
VGVGGSSIQAYHIWVLQVMLPSACSFIVEVSCHCFTLHVSAYMSYIIQFVFFGHSIAVYSVATLTYKV